MHWVCNENLNSVDEKIEKRKKEYSASDLGFI